MTIFGKGPVAARVGITPTWLVAVFQAKHKQRQDNDSRGGGSSQREQWLEKAKQNRNKIADILQIIGSAFIAFPAIYILATESDSPRFIFGAILLLMGVVFLSLSTYSYYKERHW